LKDIYTGKSRGFGFVTFKDEAVAQKLIKEVTVTEINKRKIDIKTAEPKAKSSYQPIPGKPLMNNGPQDGNPMAGGQATTIAPYGSEGAQQ
jgi:RNA recognition motif-containing protein